MTLRWSIRSLLIPGIIAYVVAVVMIHWSVDSIHITATAVGIGTIGLAIAALVTAGLAIKRYVDARGDELEARQDELDHKFNGGMIEVMTKILNDEIAAGNFRIDLVKRVADLEVKLEDALKTADEAEQDRLRCLEREQEWQRLKARMTAFLDENGAGRITEREEA